MVALTEDDGRNGEEHEGVSNEEPFHITFPHVLHSPPGQQSPGLDPGSDLAESALSPLWVLAVALSHGWNLQITMSRDVSSSKLSGNLDRSPANPLGAPLPRCHTSRWASECCGWGRRDRM